LFLALWIKHRLVVSLRVKKVLLDTPKSSSLKKCDYSRIAIDCINRNKNLCLIFFLIGVSFGLDFFLDILRKHIPDPVSPLSRILTGGQPSVLDLLWRRVLSLSSSQIRPFLRQRPFFVLVAQQSDLGLNTLIFCYKRHLLDGQAVHFSLFVGVHLVFCLGRVVSSCHVAKGRSRTPRSICSPGLAPEGGKKDEDDVH